MQGVGCALWDNGKNPDMEDIMEFISNNWYTIDYNVRKKIIRCFNIISDDEIII